MHRDGESVTGQIPGSQPISAQPAAEDEEAPLTLEEIAAPQAVGPMYSGPERRAQGYLIAELLPDSLPASGQEPELDRRR